MRVTVLASGSKGNVTLIENNDSKILIDFGLSYRKINQLLKSVECSIDEIDAIFITHEHSDHIKGLNTLTKNKNIPIYLSQGTFDAVVKVKKIGVDYQYFHIIQAEVNIHLNNIKITPYPLSHDANEPLGYIISENDKKVVYLTDTGIVTQKNEELIKNADVYILEANHNVEMLMCTSRPWYLKQRILGDYGHLCNEDALDVLHRVKGERTKYVYLAHISEEANNEDLLMLTVNNYCKKKNESTIKFMIAYQHQVSETVEV